VNGAALAPRKKFHSVAFSETRQAKAHATEGLRDRVRLAKRISHFEQNIRNVVDTPTCLVALPREDSAWRTFFRGNRANSNRGSEYSDWSTGLMANVSIEIAHVDMPLARPNRY